MELNARNQVNGMIETVAYELVTSKIKIVSIDHQRGHQGRGGRPKVKSREL
ncbi:MAG: hypothetical protein SA339_01250 [Methanomassiliicoccus sp.]|nr:hypothetical protein [Methanomassiliicoccus sp.]